MRLSITLRTCDRTLKRPGPNYLRQTLDNAARAGVFDDERLASFDVIYSHPETPTLRSETSPHRGRVTTHNPKCRLTPNVTATEAHVTADQHNADYVLFLEDDLDFCDDFLGSVARWLGDYAEPQYPLFVFGHVRSSRGSSAQPYPVNQFYGTQCYAVPRDRHAHLTKWLVDSPFYVERQNPNKRPAPRAHDLRLHNWAEDIGCSNFLASDPSFVNHIGTVSGMGCRRVVFASFPGTSWSYRRNRRAR